MLWTTYTHSEATSVTRGIPGLTSKLDLCLTPTYTVTDFVGQSIVMDKENNQQRGRRGDEVIASLVSLGERGRILMPD